MLNLLDLPLSLHPSDLHCPRNPAFIDRHMVCAVMRMQSIDYSGNEDQSCELLVELPCRGCITDAGRAVCRAEARCAMHRFKVIMPQLN